MTDEEFKELENLLGKLRGELPNGQYAISIAPECVQDLYSIGVYEWGTGRFLESGIGPTIEKAAQQVSKKLTNHAR